MNKPIAVITGDVHFTPGTLNEATEVVCQVLSKAQELGVPAILNGDTLDSKAIIRAECANALIELLVKFHVKVYINTGNHDLINEKSKESSLNFLRPYATVIDNPMYDFNLGLFMLPYYSDSEALKSFLGTKVDKYSTLIMHQGIMGADLGHYVQDKTSLDPSWFKYFRVIASHYHKRQDIVCGELKANNVGLFSYLGNPYSLSFGEANDGPKGYSILMDDGSLEFVPTNLRKHAIIELDFTKPVGNKVVGIPVNKDDLVWIKVKGPYSYLQSLDKNEVGELILGHNNYKLEKIYTDTPKLQVKSENLTDAQVLDSIIEATDESDAQKQILKELWREIL